ncbi:MAG: hypothetical protein ABIU29_03445 [Chthoniobacterales bacterium]
MKPFVFFFALVFPFLSSRATEPLSGSPGKPIARVAFAQYCFWTGEMKLGQIEGVVRTEAGFFHGHEVTLVDYEAGRLSLEQLAEQAKRAGVTDRLHPGPGSGSSANSIGGVPVGVALDGSYRAAPTSDQKKQMQGTAFARLDLTPEEATKVNAFVRSEPLKALESLAPAKRAKLAVAP